MVYRTAHFSMTLKDPIPRIPDFKVRPFFDVEYLQNGCEYSKIQTSYSIILIIFSTDTRFVGGSYPSCITLMSGFRDVLQRRLLSDSEQNDSERKDVKKKDITVIIWLCDWMLNLHLCCQNINRKIWYLWYFCLLAGYQSSKKDYFRLE